MILASFAAAISATVHPKVFPRIPARPRKAGYAAHSLHHMQVPIPRHSEPKPAADVGLHGDGVYARMPLRIAPSP